MSFSTVTAPSTSGAFQNDVSRGWTDFTLNKERHGVDVQSTIEIEYLNVGGPCVHCDEIYLATVPAKSLYVRIGCKCGVTHIHFPQGSNLGNLWKMVLARHNQWLKSKVDASGVKRPVIVWH